MKTSPRLFFFAANAPWVGVRYLSLLLAPCFLCPSGVVRSPLPALLVARRGVWLGGVCRAVVRCGGACRSSLVPSCRSDACLSAFLVSWLSAGGGAVCLIPVFGKDGGLLTCVFRFVAQYGRRVACPVWFVSVNRCGWRGGSLVALCLLG